MKFDAAAYYAHAMQRVKSTAPPAGQKYQPGSRVRIADDLGPGMGHFPGAGGYATVLHTYAHAYGGEDVFSYALDVDGAGYSAWYKEGQLSPTPTEAADRNE